MFWNKYLNSLPEYTKKPEKYEAWYFCDNEKDADELAGLVLAGIKTATCGMIWEYEADGDELPVAGDYGVITKWAGEPVCIVKTTDVQIKAFNEVDEQHAYGEGEGDRSLAYWRKIHWEVFSRYCTNLEREPSETMPLVCEKFEVVFRVEAGNVPFPKV